MSTPKEPQFFSSDEVYGRGDDWYRSLFAGAGDDQLCGEASTTYTRWPHTADAATRLAATLPNAKLIYIMRHPVDRAYSHYAHQMRLGVTATFEQAMRRDHSLIDCGLYMAQIRRFLRHFARDSFLFLLLDELKQQPAETMARVQRFLDLSVMPLTDEPIVANRSGDEHYIRQHTTRRLRRIPGLSALAERMSPSSRQALYELIHRSPVGRCLSRRHRLPAMLPETRTELLRRYERPNRELEAFLGRDLSHWST
jgi:hypothetical protein